MTEEQKIYMVNTRPRPRMSRPVKRKKKWHEKRVSMNRGEALGLLIMVALMALYFGANSRWLVEVMDLWMR